jgi:hypothetical protein
VKITRTQHIHSPVPVDGRRHEHLHAAAAAHHAGLLDGLGQHAQRVVQGPLGLLCANNVQRWSETTGQTYYKVKQRSKHSTLHRVKLSGNTV